MISRVGSAGFSGTPQASAPVVQPEAPEQAPADSFQVGEREASSSGRPVFEERPFFPGIAEGLSCEYLYSHRPRPSQNPTTLTLGFEVPPELKTVPRIGDDELTRRSIAGEPEACRYVLRTLAHTRKILQCYYPELYRDIPHRVRVDLAADNNAFHESGEDGHTLTLKLVEMPRAELAMSETEGAFQPGYRFRRGIYDLGCFAHEYAHAIYDEMQGQAASVHMDRVNRALSEGFAVLLELLTVDRLVQEKVFEADDSADLSERRRQRIVWLQGAMEEGATPARLAYAEGTELMVNLFRQGGLEAVAQFITRVQPDRANCLSRSSAAYRAAGADPEAVLKLLLG